MMILSYSVLCNLNFVCLCAACASADTPDEQRQRSTSYGCGLPPHVTGFSSSAFDASCFVMPKLCQPQHTREPAGPATRQPKSLPLPHALKLALSSGPAAEAHGRERRERKSKKDLVTSFCLHQMETCQQLDAYEQQYYTPLRSAGVLSAHEVSVALGSGICELAQMHHDLLERLQRDSDLSSRDPFAKPQFGALVHDAFFELRKPFQIYMDNFDNMFQLLTEWKSTNASFSQVSSVLIDLLCMSAFRISKNLGVEHPRPACV